MGKTTTSIEPDLLLKEWLIFIYSISHKNIKKMLGSHSSSKGLIFIGCFSFYFLFYDKVFALRRYLWVAADIVIISICEDSLRLRRGIKLAIDYSSPWGMTTIITTRCGTRKNSLFFNVHFLLVEGVEFPWLIFCQFFKVIKSVVERS